MSLNILLLHCSTHETNLSEVGAQVAVKPKAGELILLFDIRQQEAHNSYLRKEWGMHNNEPLCDGIFFYKVEGKTRICFVELKASNFEHGVDQVVNTYNVFKRNLQNSLSSKEYKSYYQQNRPEFIAYIYLSGSANQVNKSNTIVTKLTKAFGKGGFDYGHNSDLGAFLRK